MQTITISNTYNLTHQINGYEHYKVSPCGKVFNCQRGKEVRRILVGSTSGFCIEGKFKSLKQLRKLLVKIPEKEYLPF